MTEKPFPQRPPHRWWSAVLIPFAVALMLTEEYLWKGLKALMARLGQLPLVARVEDRIAALPPFGAALVFLLPGATMIPFKLAALWAIGHGQVLLGALVFISAKLTGTALFARLYTLCKPTLMTVGWFSRLHDALTRARDWAHRKLEAWSLWRLVRRMPARAKARALALVNAIRR